MFPAKPPASRKHCRLAYLSRLDTAHRVCRKCIDGEDKPRGGEGGGSGIDSEEACQRGRCEHRRRGHDQQQRVLDAEHRAPHLVGDRLEHPEAQKRRERPREEAERRGPQEKKGESREQGHDRHAGEHPQQGDDVPGAVRQPLGEKRVHSGAGEQAGRDGRQDEPQKVGPSLLDEVDGQNDPLEAAEGRDHQEREHDARPQEGVPREKRAEAGLRGF